MEGERSKCCLENLKVCNAMCCKLVGFGLKDALATRTFLISGRDVSKIRYYKMHEGITVKSWRGQAKIIVDEKLPYVIKKYKNNYLIIFNSHCQNLAPDGSCNIYDSLSRPRVCRDGYSRQKTSIVFCPDCIYHCPEDSIKLEWNEINSMKRGGKNE